MADETGTLPQKDESPSAWLARTASSTQPLPQQQLGPDAVPQDPAPQPGERPADWLGRTTAASDPNFEVTAATGLDIPVDRAARILKAQSQSGYSADFINKNLDQVEGDIKRTGFDVERLRAGSPLTAQFLKENPTRVGLFAADMRGLTENEKLLAMAADPDVRLRPFTPKEVQDQAERLADQQDQEWLASPMNALGKGTHNLEEDHATRVQQNIDRIRAEEGVIAKSGEIEPGEALANKFRENPLFLAPIFSAVDPLEDTFNAYMAAKRVKANIGSPADEELLTRAFRYQLAKTRRGETTGSSITSLVADLPAFIGSLALTGGIGKGVAAAAGGVSEGVATEAGTMAPGIAARTLGVMAQAPLALPGQTVETALKMMTPTGQPVPDQDGNFTYQINEGTGKSAAVAIPAALVSSMIDVGTANVSFNPIYKLWAGKVASPTVGGFLKDVAARGMEGVLGFIGVNEVAKLAKSAVGLEPYQAPTWQSLKAQAAVGFALGSVHRGFERYEAWTANSKAETTSNLIGKVSENVQDMQAQKASPEEVQKAIAAQTAGTGAEHTFLPAPDFAVHFEQQGIDPHELATELTGDPSALEDALRDGHDLRVPTGAYIAKIGATPDGAFFQPKLRLDPAAPNLDESQKHLAELDTQMEAERKAQAEARAAKAAKKEGEGAPAEEPSLPEQIGKNLREQLEGAGFKAEAKQYQALIESGFSQFAEKAKAAGIDPAEFLKRYTPTIDKGAPPEGEGQFVKVMDQSGTHIEKVAGDTPAEAVLAAHEKWADATIEPMTDEEVKNFLPLAMERPETAVTLDQAARGQQPQLSALHNLSEENLAFAHELGGIPVPSVAVVPKGVPLSGYGGVTMIGDKHLADPANVPVYDADAYSPTFPRPEYRKVSTKPAQKLVDEIRPFADKFDNPSVKDSIWDNAVNHPDPEKAIGELTRSDAAAAWFLKSKGIKVEPVTKKIEAGDTRAPFIDTPVFRKFVESGELKKVDHNDPASWTEYSKVVEKAIDQYFEHKDLDLSAEDRADMKEIYKKEFFDPENGDMFFGRSQRIELALEHFGKNEVDRGATHELVKEKLDGHEAEFKSWLEEKILPMYGEPSLTVKGRKVPFDLENIVESMSGRVRAREENMTFGEGAARAKASKRFNNLEQMRKAAGSNIAGEAEISAARETANKLMEDYRDKVLPFTTYMSPLRAGHIDTWEALDSSMRAMAKWAKTGAKDEASMQRALRSEGFREVPPEVLSKAVEAGRAWLKAPVPYFEAKPQRAVGLSEFAGAVIPEKASAETRAILDENKVPYRTYADEASRPAVVDQFRDELAKSGKTVLFQPGEGQEGPRGQIRIGDSAISISLLERADPSTFLHETGHLYLEMLGDLAGHEKATDQVKGDYAAVRDWLGLKDGEAIGRAQHEQFARGFEQYLMEGNAPSSKLRQAFSRFKDWLVEIYKNIRNLDVQLNPKVRGVFDRLLASDEEIKHAYEQRGRAEAFLSAAPNLKMSEADAAKYADLIDQAHEAAKSKLDTEALADIRQAQTEKYQRDRVQVKKDVTEEINARPEQIALARLTRHKTPSGEDLPAELPRLKLDKTSIDPEVLKTLPRGVTGRDGLTPDGAAEQLGFPSGEALLKGLHDATNVEGYGIPSPKEAEIRTNLAHLEETRKALEAVREPLESEAKAATAEAMAGKVALAREYAKSMRMEERAKIKDVQEMLSDIRDRGGIRPTDPKTEALPRKFKASGDHGVGSDELAQELYDRGIIKDPTSDDLYDWLQIADSQVQASRERLKAIEGEAKDLAKRKVKDSLEALVENTKGQEQLRAELAESTAQRRTLEGGILKNPREAIIERTTNQRMAQLHEKPVEALDDKAAEAIHNDNEAKLKAYEIEWLVKNKPNTMKGLIRLVTDPVKYVQSVRDYADQKMKGMTDNEVKVGVYQTAERQARVAAREALLKNDIDGAIAFKQRELLNHELFQAASEMKADVKDIAKYMRKFTDKDVRARIGKADPASRDQIDEINDRFAFTPPTGAKLASQQLLVDFIKEKTQNGGSIGEEIAAPQFLRDAAFRMNYRDLKYSDLQALRDTVKQIETSARLTTASMALEKKVTRVEMRREILDGLRKNFEKRDPDSTRNAMTMVEKLKKAGRQMDAGLLKTEQFVREADAGDIMGPLRKYLFNGSAEAQTAEFDLQTKVGAEVVKAVETLPDELRKGLDEVIQLPGRRRITMYDVMGFAAQMGNASNADKFARGEAMREGGFTAGEINDLINRLKPEHATAIQGLWDAQETLWPLIDEKHEKWTGLKLEKVQASPQHSLFTGMRGGYMPVIYEASQSRQGQMQEAARIGELQQDGYQSATTASGYRRARVEAFTAPMDTDLRNLPSHIGSVIKDLTHREWMIDANWILGDKEIQAEIRDRVGPEMLGRLNEWVQQVVNSRNQSSLQSLAGFRGLYNACRLNIATVASGFKVTTLLHHATSAAAAVDMIGPEYFAQGVSKSFQAPRDAYNEMTEKSGEMRHFLENSDREVSDNIRRLEGRSDPLAQVQKAASYAVGMMNLSRAMPTWWGAYLKAIDTLPGEKGLEGAELEKYSVMSADEAVRLAIGTSHAKDLAAIMASKNDITRAFTMFYTPGSVLYSRLHDIGHEAGQTRDIPKAMVRVFWTAIVAGTLQKFVSGEFPNKKKDEGWGAWWAKSMATYPASSIPMVRETADFLINGREPSNGNPVLQDAMLIKSSIEDGAKAAKGEEDPDKFAVQALRSANYWAGLPADQLITTGNYLYQLNKGNVDKPNDLWEFYHDLLHGRRK